MPSNEDKNKSLKEELKEQITDNCIEELMITKQQLDEMKDNYKEMEKELNQYKDLLQRKQAEFVNYKKRVTVEKENMAKYAIEKILEDLLPGIDSLEKAIVTSTNSKDINGIKEGIINVEKLFKSIIGKHGVKPFDSEGEEFDPNLHEAVQVEESDKSNKDIVSKEWQKGYMIGDKVLRHSKVTVIKSTKEIHNEDIDNENIDKEIENIETDFKEDE